jgi:hypothetical protein
MRKHAAFFAGTIWDDLNYSFGLRQTAVKQYENSTFVRFSQSIPDYKKKLSKYRFCLYLPGWASWSHRLFEIIDHGCIPVIVFDRSLMPLEHILRWDLASLYVSEIELKDGSLEKIIENISEDSVKRLFDGLLKIRSILYREKGTGKGYGDGFAEILESELCRLYQQRPNACTHT